MIYPFPEFQPEAFAGFSGRDFDAAKDLNRFLEAIGASSDRSCVLKQVHGDHVLFATEPFTDLEADGLVTRERGLALVIRTADCAPIFFFDRRVRAVALAHAGWRGAKEKIVPRTIEKLRAQCDSKPRDLCVAIGPAIRETCYEVGQEFEELFPGRVKRRGPQWFFDLIGELRSQLVEEEVPETAICDSNVCTACSVDRFFSARREGNDTGRFLSAIFLR